MKAFVLEAPGKFCICDAPMPNPMPNEVLIRVVAAGICGSDVPRIMETGAYQHPLIPGHEFAGEIVAVGEGVSEELVGRRVAVYPLIPCGLCRWCREGAYNLCNDYDYLGSRRDGAFAEYVCAPVQNAIRIPNGVPTECAALSEPAGVALHGLKRAGMKRGDNVVVFGAGPIGLLLCQMAKLLGAERVCVIDVVEEKLKLAEQYEWAWTVNASTEDAVRAIRTYLPDGADVVIDAAGAPPVAIQVIQVARKRGRILLLGNPHGDVTIPKKVLSTVLRREVQIVGTWNSLPHEDWLQVLDWMASNEIQIEPLISHRISLDELPNMIRAMHSGSIVCEKVLVVMD